MPDRTEEELQQIYEDLVIYSKVLNELHELGELWPIPMNGKTWEEEKNEFYFTGINTLDDLIRSGKIKSCEVISYCESIIQESVELSNQEEFWNHCGRVWLSSTHDNTIDDRLSIDGMIEIVNNLLNNELTPSKVGELNREIDELGNRACGPRAMMEYSGKAEEVNNNSSLPTSKNLHCFQKT